MALVRKQTLARDLIVGAGAVASATIALGFCAAGAYTLLSQVYSPAAALFMIGGGFAAVAVLLTLYLVLGGHEIARAAYADPAVQDAQNNMLDGLAPGPELGGVEKPAVNPRRNRRRSVSLLLLGIAVTSWTAVKRFTHR